MKTSALLSIILFFLLATEKNDYISIEYMGSGDKPIRVIYISTKPIPKPEQIITVNYNDLPKNYIVYNDEFAFIKNTINSTPREEFKKKYYHGAKVTLREKNDTTSFFIDRKNYNVLFLKVSHYLKYRKTNKALIKHLSLLRTENVGGSAF